MPDTTSTPDQWRQAWEHRVVTARRDDRLLPAPAREFLLSYGMPKLLVFECEAPFEISFSRLSNDLVDYSKLVRWGDFYDEALDIEWRNQVVIGEEDFCNGSASYCVHRETGEVFRIDCELRNPQCFVNSSAARLGLSLLAAKRWSADLWEYGARPARASVDLLGRELRDIDAQAFESGRHFWRSLVERITNDQEFDLKITDDPARSKPRF